MDELGEGRCTAENASSSSPFSSSMASREEALPSISRAIRSALASLAR